VWFFNGSSDFAIATGLPAVFIFVTEDGTISGWDPKVDPLNAIKEWIAGTRRSTKERQSESTQASAICTSRISVRDKSKSTTPNFKRAHAFDEAFTEDDHDHDADAAIRAADSRRLIFKTLAGISSWRTRNRTARKKMKCTVRAWAS